MPSLQSWLHAFRLRTLPLALSSIFMGSFLAQSQQKFRLDVFLLAVLTTILLQLLSNLANDYGDFMNGADNADRQGPKRMVQTGEISPTQMLNAMYLFGAMAFVSGLWLLAVAIQSYQDFFVFLGLGILCIIGAITYTAGKKPYGYAGLGDISVFVFFGLVGVGGSFYLHTHTWTNLVWLPAMSCGLLATGVLNINNIRDIETDKNAGKKTIPVRIGRTNASFYHLFLILGSIFCAVFYMIFTQKDVIFSFQKPQIWLFLLAFPLLFLNIKGIFTEKTPQKLDPYLKQLALSTLLFVLLFGISNQ
jgi:1,4-dihydroxy-2-naphthoate polyprenyltransferase